MAAKNPVAIAWQPNASSWDLIKHKTVDQHIANLVTDDYSYFTDYQMSQNASVCIDHDAYGFDFEEPDLDDYDYGAGLVHGTLECLDVDKKRCEHSTASEKMTGAGSLECEKRTKWRGDVHVCKATCDSGEKPKGAKVTRCKTWGKVNYSRQTATKIGKWQTKNDNMINC